MKLNKSYRSTYEIIQFAKRIQSVSALEPIERHGEKPAFIQCRDRDDEIRYLQDKMEAFIDSENATLGIIMKTNQAAKMLFDALAENDDIHLIAPDSLNFINGISITSVQMSKDWNLMKSLFLLPMIRPIPASMTGACYTSPARGPCIGSLSHIPGNKQS